MIIDGIKRKIVWIRDGGLRDGSARIVSIKVRLSQNVVGSLIDEEIATVQIVNKNARVAAVGNEQPVVHRVHGNSRWTIKPNETGPVARAVFRVGESRICRLCAGLTKNINGVSAVNNNGLSR